MDSGTDWRVCTSSRSSCHRRSQSQSVDRDSTALLNRTRLAKCCLLGVQVLWRADTVRALATLKRLQKNRALQPLAGDLLGLLEYGPDFG